VEPAVAEAPEPDDVEAEAAEDVTEAVADDGAEPGADGHPKKKRTRRGTRGGRGRKKPETAVADDAAAADLADNGRSAGPRIHVPPPDLEATADAGEPEPAVDVAAAKVDAAEAPAAESDAPAKKKRSRRGSRGGRKRKKPATNGGDGAAAYGEPETAEPAGGDGVAEYVPMSEWIEDFDASKRA
jgi:ribonuclease E